MKIQWQDDVEGESRELNHEEIWDDSALIDAWNSANAEYEASDFFETAMFVFDLRWPLGIPW